ncbi:MAG: hypothetical protein ACRDLF_12090 [Solirubrobacteraceae bacterium]
MSGHGVPAGGRGGGCSAKLARPAGVAAGVRRVEGARGGVGHATRPRVTSATAALLAASVVAVLAALLAGCGASVELPDLFVVQRSGSVRGAPLTLVVNEGGSVRCGRGPVRPTGRGATRQLSDPQLVEARGLSEELQGPSAKHLTLPPRPGSVFRYYVRDAEGAVRFADNSAGQPSVLRHLAYFVLEVAEKVCGLAV